MKKNIVTLLTSLLAWKKNYSLTLNPSGSQVRILLPNYVQKKEEKGKKNK